MPSRDKDNFATGCCKIGFSGDSDLGDWKILAPATILGSTNCHDALGVLAVLLHMLSPR